MTNSASPAEKLAQLHNQRLLRQGDQPAPSTLFAQSQVGRRLDGSTNYEATRDLIQAGEGLVVEYPRLPASSPWSGVGPQVPRGTLRRSHRPTRMYGHRSGSGGVPRRVGHRNCSS